MSNNSTQQPERSQGLLIESGSPMKNKRKLKSISTFQKGSNIPGLLSYNATQENSVPDPKLPAIKVRDLGRDIMLRSNKCSWYDGMTAKEEDQKPSAKEKQTDEAPEEGKLTTQNCSNVCSNAVNPPPSEAGELLTDNCQSCSNDHLLKRIEEQQEQILSQQKELQAHMNGEAKPSELPGHFLDSHKAAGDDSPKKDMTEKREDAHVNEKQNRRRLKGEIAEMCASRDEGSIKSIVWFQ